VTRREQVLTLLTSWTLRMEVKGASVGINKWRTAQAQITASLIHAHRATIRLFSDVHPNHPSTSRGSQRTCICHDYLAHAW